MNSNVTCLLSNVRVFHEQGTEYESRMSYLFSSVVAVTVTVMTTQKYLPGTGLVTVEFE